MNEWEEKITDIELAAKQQIMLRRALHDNRLVTIDNPNFNNMSGKIYINEGNGQYQVLIDTPTGTFKKTVYSKDINRKNGEEIMVLWDNETKRYTF